MNNNTYGSPYPNTNNVATSSNPYQTNIGRTKTKKWVTAPTQNYDGDDWGNEFEEDEPEQVPALPRDAAHRYDASTGARNMSGPPSLRLHTQPHPHQGAASPPHGGLPSGARRSFTAGAGGNALDAAAATSPVPNTAPVSHSPTGFPMLPSQREATSPQVTSPSSLLSDSAHGKRFPARKSSLSTTDGPPDLTIGARSQGSGSGPSSRPASGHTKPWMEPRSASPQGPRSPPGGSSGGSKPLPFIRPSEIYRRMEEEKDRQRQSSDLARSSVDSDRVQSPARSASGAVEVSTRSAEASEKAAGEVPAAAAKPAALPTVAERKSEYGLETFLAGSGTNFLQLNFESNAAESKAALGDHPAAKPGEGAAATVAKEGASSAGAAAEETAVPAASENTRPALQSEQNKMSIDLEETDDDDLRRFSSSPKLPDLARMSSFGFDFLGSAPVLDQDQAPPVPAIAEEHQAEQQQQRGLKKHTAIDETEKKVAQEEQAKEQEPKMPKQTEQEEEEAGAIGSSSPTKTPAPAPDEAQSQSKSPNQSHQGQSHSQSQSQSQSHSQSQSLDKQAATEISRQPSHRKPAPDPIEVVSRTATMESQASPVKESDKLTDEIMRSLSPQVGAGNLEAKGADSMPRESAYLGDVYDYYGSLDDKPAEEEMPSPPPPLKPDSRPASPQKEKVLTATPKLDDDQVPDGSMSPKPLNTHKKQSSIDPPTKLRHKFSWEADSEEVKASSPASLKLPDLVLPSDPLPASEAEPKETAKETAKETSRDQGAQASPYGRQAPQSSQTSLLGSSAVLEPISPVSVVSADKDSQEGDETRSRTLAEEKDMIKTSTSPIELDHPALSPVTSVTRGDQDRDKTATPEPAEPGSPALSDQARQQRAPESPSVKIWTFREIMALPTSAERVERFVETRHVFARLDSGLGPWLGAMVAAAPEHANPSSQLGDDLNSFAGGDGRTSPGGTRAADSTQHHVNASTASLALGGASGPGEGGSGGGVPSGGRPLSGMGNLSHFTSDFRHSGAKGKELLKSAGKAGKGFFSKSKSKLQTAREEWR